ncbi:MAG TPA: glycosyltransferase family 39 protein [Xanthobacteraceae bacterium]|nr:glycosyltransferase family 39 protein [Xanthobacteraceae bacterium]
MLYVSLILEILRSRPALVFWGASLLQAAVWALVPALFYAAPPDDLAFTLATGREFVLGSPDGPPLAYWAAEAAYRTAGMAGVYVVAQLCIVAAYWAMFRLACRMVGVRHAVLAMLPMIGIPALTVFSPDFGPAIAVLPVWSFLLLHLWRAAAEGERPFWLAVGAEAGLLVLITPAALALLVALAAFVLLTRPGRAALKHPEPWLGMLLAGMVAAPYLAWLAEYGASGSWRLAGVWDGAAMQNLAGKLVRSGWQALWLFGLVAASHLGLALLVFVVSGWPLARRAPQVPIERDRIAPVTGRFLLCLAGIPLAVACLAAAAWALPLPWGGIGVLSLLSGLAVVVWAGRDIRLYRQYAGVYLWLALLLGPPVLMMLWAVGSPYFMSAEARISQPAGDIGRVFADEYRKRTGRPLAAVGGDARLAALIALHAPERPRLVALPSDARATVARLDDLRRSGGIVVWPTQDVRGAPPAAVAAQLPGLSPEVARSFARPVEGRLLPLRIGWALVPPADAPEVAGAASLRGRSP